MRTASEALMSDLELLFQRLPLLDAELRALPPDGEHAGQVPRAQPVQMMVDCRDSAGAASQLVLVAGVPLTRRLLHPFEQGVGHGDTSPQDDVRPVQAGREPVHEVVLPAFFEFLGRHRDLEATDLLEDSDLNAVDLEQEPAEDRRLATEPLLMGGRAGVTGLHTHAPPAMPARSARPPPGPAAHDRGARGRAACPAASAGGKRDRRSLARGRPWDNASWPNLLTPLHVRAFTLPGAPVLRRPRALWVEAAAR